MKVSPHAELGTSSLFWLIQVPEQTEKPSPVHIGLQRYEGWEGQSTLASSARGFQALSALASRLTQGSAWFEGSQSRALPCASVIQHTFHQLFLTPRCDDLQNSPPIQL